MGVGTMQVTVGQSSQRDASGVTEAMLLSHCVGLIVQIQQHERMPSCESACALGGIIQRVTTEGLTLAWDEDANDSFEDDYGTLFIPWSDVAEIVIP